MAKVFQINYTIATRSKLNTNSIKGYIGKLLSMGKAAQVISNALTPVKATSPIALFLVDKIDFKFLKGEMIVLTKQDKFIDGESITAANLQKKVSDVLPGLNDKAGNSLEIDVIDINCKKL